MRIKGVVELVCMQKGDLSESDGLHRIVSIAIKAHHVLWAYCHCCIPSCVGRSLMPTPN